MGTGEAGQIVSPVVGSLEIRHRGGLWTHVRALEDR